MSNPQFYDRLNRLKDDIMRFKNSVCAYETIDAARYPDNFESLGIDMAMRAEAIACSARNIVSAFPSGSRKRVLANATDTHGIKVRKRGFGYEILMPGLMPKRNRRNNSEFLLEPLCYALEQFCREQGVERMDRATIWYIYEYAENLPARHIRDYDNLEAKEVLDIINAFFLLDDGGEFCELHYSTRRGKRNCTRVIISHEVGLFEGQISEAI